MPSIILKFIPILMLLLQGIASDKPPNIVFILADDMGWNQASWNNISVLTPHMQELAETGVILDQSYVQPLCTPSRAALMTGMYPFHTGRQAFVIGDLAPTGLDRNLTILPERLKALGYNTHMIGKWHLGMCSWSYTPTYRGFDTFYGYLGGSQYYYSHSSQAGGIGGGQVSAGGFDFRDNERVAWEVVGTYTTDLYSSRAVQVIEKEQSSENPFFLYLPLQTPHGPFEVPQEYYDMYPEVEDQITRTSLGMMSAMDDMIGTVVEALKNTGEYDNTIIIFSSDNGNNMNVLGSNYPLRGFKGQLWEGGTRAPGFIHSPLLQNTPRVYQGLLHISDWHNTLLAAAGQEDLPQTDGYNQWEALRTGDQESPREELVYNLVQINQGILTFVQGAIRSGEYKYLTGMGNQANNFTGDWLINLQDDPNETTNLINDLPELALEMESTLMSLFDDDYVPADVPGNNQDGDPSNWGSTHSPGWCI